MSGCTRCSPPGDSPRANASWMARTTSTFSWDTAYSSSPTALRASSQFVVPVRVAAYVFVAAREGYDVSPLDGHLYAAPRAAGPQREEGENSLPEVLDPLDLDVEGLVVPGTLQ